MITGYQFFKRPFPYFHRKWQLVALIAMSVSVVLTIVQNFFNEQATALIFILNTVGYTIVAAISSSIVIYVFPRLFKRFFDEKQWTTGKYFTFSFIIILMIAVANTLYSYSMLMIFYDAEIEVITFFFIFSESHC